MRPDRHLRLSRAVLISAFLSLLFCFGCARDAESPSVSDANGISAPAPGGQSVLGCADVDMYHSTIPKGFMLSARNGNTLDPRCEYQVTVRNSSDQGISGIKVELMWSPGSYPRRMVCVPTSPPVPGMTYTLDSNGFHHLTNFTDASGIAHFRLGGGFVGFAHQNDVMVPGFTQVAICDGAYTTPLFGGFTPSTPDLNSSGGVNSADLSLFNSDLFGAYQCRSDFNGDGLVNAADQSILLGIMFGGGSVASCQ